MPTIANTARERLGAGQLSLGMALRQARTVDIGRVLAACGYDFAFIDMEHNTMSVDTAAQIARRQRLRVEPSVRASERRHHGLDWQVRRRDALVPRCSTLAGLGRHLHRPPDQ